MCGWGEGRDGGIRYVAVTLSLDQQAPEWRPHTRMAASHMLSPAGSWSPLSRILLSPVLPDHFIQGFDVAVTLCLDLVPISQGEQRLVPAQLKGSNLHKGVGRQEAGGKGLGSHSVSISSRSARVTGVLTREEGGGHGEGRGGQGSSHAEWGGVPAHGPTVLPHACMLRAGQSDEGQGRGRGHIRAWWGGRSLQAAHGGAGTCPSGKVGLLGPSSWPSAGIC